MRRLLPIFGVVAGLAVAAPAAQAAPTALDVASNGQAVTISGTPAAGATTFTFRYTGTSKKGVTSPTVVRLGPGATPEQVLAAIKTLKPDTGPEALLASTQSRLLIGQDGIPKGPGKKVTAVLAPGNYLVVDGTDKPADAFGAGFTVPAATGPVAALPKTGATVSLSDYRIRAPKRISARAAWTVQNRGNQLHFLLAIGVPKGLSDKAAIRAIRHNKDKPFRRSPFAEVVGLTSPGVANVVRPGLRRGRWLLVCFYANEASQGRPHSMLGMETVVTVR